MSGLDLAAEDDTGASDSDNITVQATGLTVGGSGENGAAVSLYDDVDNDTVQDLDEATLATAVVSGGMFSAELALGTGVHHIRAFQTDLAGNVGATSSALDVTVDTAAGVPTGLDLAAADDTGASSSDNITRLTSGLTIGGNGENGSTVSLFDDANDSGVLDGSETVIATAAVSGGVFSADLTLAEGEYRIRAFQTDAAGNVGAASASLVLTVDTTVAPVSAAAVSFTVDSGAADGITSDNDLLFTGRAEASSTVVIYDGGAVLGTAVTDSTGFGTFQTEPLADGVHVLTATVTDLAGNVSALSAEFFITIDTAVPTAIGTVTALGADTGSSSADFVTKTASQTVSGTFSGVLGAGETLQVSADGTSWVDATAGAGT